jgi:hypothetical protein
VLSAEPITVATAPANSEPAPGAVSNEVSQKDQEPGETGTIAVTSNSELKPAPDELSSVESAAAAEDKAGSKTVELSQDRQPAQAGAELSDSATPAGGDLP